MNSIFLLLDSKCYIAGLSYVVNISGLQNPTDLFIVNKLLAGYKKSMVSRNLRKPIP